MPRITKTRQGKQCKTKVKSRDSVQQYLHETIFSIPAACFKVVLTETKSAPQENCTETPPTSTVRRRSDADTHSQLAGTGQDILGIIFSLNLLRINRQLIASVISILMHY